MQEREEQTLARLAEAQLAQANAMKRFALTQGRVAQLEARLQRLQTTLTARNASPGLPDQAQELHSEAEVKTDATVFLPQNGELELLEHFASQQQEEGEEPTERLAAVRADQLPTTPCTTKSEQVEEKKIVSVGSGDSTEQRGTAEQGAGISETTDRIEVISHPSKELS